MPTAAASGSGEPPEWSDYVDEETLPRSGLLEQRAAADAPRSVVVLCQHPGGAPLSAGVRGSPDLVVVVADGALSSEVLREVYGWTIALRLQVT